MAVRVAAHKIGARYGIVTIEADNQEEVMSMPARALAIKTAQQHGLLRAGVSGTDSAYPVDADGNFDDSFAATATVKVAAYRCDYRVTGAP